MRRFSLLLATLALLLLPVAGAGATTFQVTTGADSNSGTCAPGACTLRQAVEAANASSGPDDVAVPAGDYALVFGQIQNTGDLTLTGAGLDATSIVATGTFRLFANSAGVSMRIVGVTITGGRVKGTGASEAMGGGVFNQGAMVLDRVAVAGNTVEPADNTGVQPRGGGVYSSGSLKISESLIEGNLATNLPFNGGIPRGGGVYNDDGSLEVLDSSFLGNEARVETGGIPEGGGLGSGAETPQGASTLVVGTTFRENVVRGGEGTIPDGAAVQAYNTDLTVRQSSLVANRSISGKGGIANAGGLYFVGGGELLLAESLVAENVLEAVTLGDGGGLFVIGSPGFKARVVNSTIAGNRIAAAAGGSGGGFFYSGSGTAVLEVVNSTIASNIAEAGPTSRAGNIFSSVSGEAATVLRNSIVAAGTTSGQGSNCYGKVVSAGHNIESADDCGFGGPGDQVNTDPRLGLLADNGGPTRTMALAAGSPALDAAGEPCPATDQRGVPRLQGPACDIGAFEVEVPVPPSPPASGQAKLRFLGKRVAIGPKTGKGRLRVRCLNVPGDLCSVKLRLLAPAPKSGKARASKRRVKIGTVTGAIDGGKTGAFRVKLNKRGRALLAASPNAKLRVRAAGKSRNRASEPVSIKARLLLKLKNKRPNR